MKKQRKRKERVKNKRADCRSAMTCSAGEYVAYSDEDCAVDSEVDEEREEGEGRMEKSGEQAAGTSEPSEPLDEVRLQFPTFGLTVRCQVISFFFSQ